MLPELIDITIATTPDTPVKHWLTGVSFCAEFLETRIGISTQRPYINDITIGVEAKFFTIEITLVDKEGNQLDLTGVEIADYTNLYEYNDNLIWSSAGNIISLRPATFGSAVSFTVKLPGYQSNKFVFTPVAGDMLNWRIPLQKQITEFFTLINDETLINTNPADGENNILA